MVENIKKSLDNKTNVCGLFIDLQTAFDMVNHKILLDKLYHCGVRRPDHICFESYLTDIKRKMQIDSIDLGLMKILCDVPQGFMLGPLLFLIYVK